MSRLSSFFVRASTIANADPPDAAAHDVHAEQSRHDEVDVARAPLAHLRSVDAHGIAPSGARAVPRRPRAIAPCAPPGRVSSKRYSTPPSGARNDDERDLAGAQRGGCRGVVQHVDDDPESVFSESSRARLFAALDDHGTCAIASAGLFRNAMPSPIASRTGKMNTQNTASGSR